MSHQPDQHRHGKVLVTGGAGYIGSHVCVELLQAGYDVVIVDDLSNASRHVLDRIQRICHSASARLPFYRIDVRSPVRRCNNT
jgi:UDP-glucose 4-epimerase